MVHTCIQVKVHFRLSKKCLIGKNDTHLWYSLERKGISQNSKFLKIFKSMYSQLKSCVKIKNGLTRYFECHIGTRQGCVSSPIIFSLFINDLAWPTGVQLMFFFCSGVSKLFGAQ